MVPDAPIIRAGDGTQFGAAVARLEGSHQLAAMREQSVLHVDPRQGRRQLAQIARRCAHKAAELAEGPMGRRHRRVVVRKHESEALRIVGGSLYADRARLDCPGRCGLGTRADDVKKLVQGKVALRSEEHTSELQSLMRISYAVFCLKNKTRQSNHNIFHPSILLLLHTHEYYPHRYSSLISYIS